MTITTKVIHGVTTFKGATAITKFRVGKKRKSRHIESQYQKAVIQWARYLEPQYPEIKWLHAIPNGGKRNPKEAARLKAEGVKPGVMDLFLPVARGGYFGMYIEMKGPDGQLSVDQAQFQLHTFENGYYAIVCNDPQKAIKAIRWYLDLVPTVPRYKMPHLDDPRLPGPTPV